MPQNFKNHSRFVKGYHIVLTLVILAILVMAIINLVEKIQDGKGIGEGIFFVLIAIAFILSFWFLRQFPLKAQDRAIRAEENLRHFALTGKLLDKRLTIGQIIALRFAPDDELPSLAKEAAEKGLDNKSIKQAIVNWKEDNHRV
jgi:hypothetical protein